MGKSLKKKPWIPVSFSFRVIDILIEDGQRSELPER